MRFEDALKLMREGKKVRMVDWKPNSYIWLDEENMLKDDNNRLTSFICDCDSMLNDIWEIFGESVLNKQEKKYLESFLRPFTKAYKKIEIKKLLSKDSCFNWIEIYCYTFKQDTLSSNFLRFPKFVKDKHMYEGMKLDKYYTLEELGLYEEEWK